MSLSGAEAASVLQWWVEAGVDTIVGEEPRDWLRPRADPSPPAPGAPAIELPDRLDLFQAWLMESGGLPFAAPGAPRVGPGGDAAAGLMVLVEMPSEEDIRAGRLLSGDSGRLFDRILAAIGRSRETVYLASLSPARAPSGRLDEESGRRWAEVARHHVALAAPRALLLFGDSCSKALLGAAVPRTRGRWHEVETAAGPVKTLATIRPQDLLERPGLKALAWADLQMLVEELKR